LTLISPRIMMPFVRTTLTLDPEVARLISEEVHRVHKPFKQVVNDAIRRGLAPGPARAASGRYRVRPHEAKLRPGVDVAHLNALVDEMEIGGAHTSRSKSHGPSRPPRRRKVS
jgi:hypothetical protein